MRYGKLILLLLLACNLYGQIALIAHNKAQATSSGGPGTGTATTPAMNGTGGNFAAACVVTYSKDCTTATVSDSVNGTWTSHGTNFSNSSGATSNVCLWWKENASVSSSMTASATVTGGFAALAAAIFSNVTTSSPRDQGQGNSANAPATLQPGAGGTGITPAGNNELGISCLGAQTSTTNTGVSISGGSPAYTKTDEQDPTGSNGQGIALAYSIQTTATASDPTWTIGWIGLTGTSATQDFFTKLVPSTDSLTPAHSEAF